MAAFWTAQVIYIGSYALLYRRGVAEANAYGYRFFFYVPLESVAQSRDLTWQHRLRLLYWPLNQVHQQCFGGRDPCVSVTWSSGP